MPKHEPIGFSLNRSAGWRAAPRPRQADDRDLVLEFSQGTITRQQAMRALGIGYSELLDQLSKRQLPLPRVSEEEAGRMADSMVRLLA
jgi:hypothetical protein